MSDSDQTERQDDEESVEAHGGGQWSGKTEDQPDPDSEPGDREGGGQWGG